MTEPVRPLNDRVLSAHLSDVSTAGQIYIPSPYRGEIVAIYTALNGAIGTANAGLTAKINGTAVTGGTITITQSGSAAGDVDSCEPTGANTVEQGDNIEIETDGASSNAVAVSIAVVVRT